MEELFKKLRNGGAIVSTNDLSETEIAEARACNRMWVDEDGFGYVYFKRMEYS